MFGMDALDGVLLAAASYVSVMALVRLMRRRRESIIAKLTREVELEKQRAREAARRERHKRLREQRRQERRQQKDAA